MDTVTVSDEIFSGTTLLGVEDCEPVVVPANTTQLVCTHMVDAPYDVTDLSTPTSADPTDGLSEDGTQIYKLTVAILEGDDLAGTYQWWISP